MLPMYLIGVNITLTCAVSANGALLCAGKPVLKPYGQCADKAAPARDLGHHSRVYLYLFPVGCGLYPAGSVAARLAWICFNDDDLKDPLDFSVGF